MNLLGAFLCEDFSILQNILLSVFKGPEYTLSNFLLFLPPFSLSAELPPSPKISAYFCICLSYHGFPFPFAGKQEIEVFNTIFTYALKKAALSILNLKERTIYSKQKPKN